MKKNYHTLVLLVFLSCANLYGQDIETAKKMHVRQLSENLVINITKAEKVAEVMDAYKHKAKILLSDKSINQDELKLKFDALIVEKNNALEKFLTEEQLQKIIPDAERKAKVQRKL